MANLGQKLKMLRRERGLRQGEVARLSGIGRKSISSFETGKRLESLKVGQLLRLLEIYGVSEADFFGEAESCGYGDPGPDRRAVRVLRRLSSLPDAVQDALVAKIQLMVETADEVHTLSRPRPWNRDESDWQLLNSHN